MGTRADFYVGKGKNAEWIGSVAWDGYIWYEDTDNLISNATSEAAFRVAVNAVLEGRDDATHVEDGWPWPWSDSCTTDCAYCFVDGHTEAFAWGAPLVKDADGAWSSSDTKAEWPDMTKVQKVTLGERSGVMVFGVK